MCDDRPIVIDRVEEDEIVIDQVDREEGIEAHRFAVTIKKSLRGLGLSVCQSTDRVLRITETNSFVNIMTDVGELPKDLILPDDIVEQIDDTPVNTIRQLQEFLARIPIGGFVAVQFVREKNASKLFETDKMPDDHELEGFLELASQKRKDKYSTARMLYLIANFLSQCTPCRETVNVLQEEVRKHGILPPQMLWNGKLNPGSIADLRFRFGEQEGNELVQLVSRNITEPPKLSQAEQLAKRDSYIRNSKQLVGFREQMRLLSKRIGVDKNPTLLNQMAELEKNIYILRRKCSVGHAQQRGRAGFELTRPSIPFAWKKTTFLKKTQGHSAFVYCVCCDPTEKYVVTGSDDHLIKIWSAMNGNLIRTLRGHSNFVCDIRIKQRGANLLLASASTDLTIRIWDLEDGICICILPGHTKSIENIRWDSNDCLLYSCSNDGAACMWDIETLCKSVMDKGDVAPQMSKAPIVLPHVSKQTGKTVEVNTLASHLSEPILATGTEDGSIYIWHTAKEPNACCQKALIPASPILTGAYHNGSNRLVNIIPSRFQVVSLLRWSARRLLGSSAKDGLVRLWDWTTISLFNLPKPGFALSSRPIMKESDDDTEKQQTKRVKRLPNIDAFTWSCDGRWIITAQSVSPAPSQVENLMSFWDQQIRVWDSQMQGILAHVLRKHRNRATSLVAHPTIPRLCLSAGWDGQILLWDIVSGSLVFEAIALHPNGIALVFDLNFMPLGKSSADIVCSDSMGRLCFLGACGDKDFKATPPVQFFDSDRAELTYDTAGFAVDSATQLPPHLIPDQRLCDVQMVPYDFQFASYHERVRSVSNLESVIELKEAAALHEVRDILVQQDEDIEKRAKGIRVVSQAPRRAAPPLATPTVRQPQPMPQPIQQQVPLRENSNANDLYEEEEDVVEEEVDDTISPRSPGGSRSNVRRAARRAQGRMRHATDMLEDDNLDCLSYFSDESEPGIPDEEATTSAPFLDEWIRLSNQFSHAWVLQHDGVPQLDEHVIYFADLHKKWTDTELARRRDLNQSQFNHTYSLYSPWMVPEFSSSWSAVRCVVTDMKYVSPFDRKCLRGKNDALEKGEYHVRNHAICVELVMKVLAHSLASSGETGLGTTETWRELPASGPPILFKVSLPPPESGLSEFLVPVRRFNESIAKCFQVGLEVDTITHETGIVVQLDALHDSPFNHIHVKTPDDDIKQFSPWELRLSSNSDWIMRFGVPLDQEVANRLAGGFQNLATREVAEPFSQPVDTSFFVLYKSVIPLPLDLSTISELLVNGKYRSLHQLFFHVALLSINCQAFNPVGSPLRKMGTTLVRLANQMIVENVPMSLIPSAFNTGKNELARKKARRKMPIVQFVKNKHKRKITTESVQDPKRTKSTEVASRQIDNHSVPDMFIPMPSMPQQNFQHYLSPQLMQSYFPPYPQQQPNSSTSFQQPYQFHNNPQPVFLRPQNDDPDLNILRDFFNE